MPRTAQPQGVSTGTLGTLVAYVDTDMLVLTSTVVVNPLVIVAPAVATGFAVGCSTGAVLAQQAIPLSGQLSSVNFTA